MNLSLNASYPTSENISTLIGIAWNEAYNLAMNAPIVTPELIEDLIRKAYMEASIIKSKIES